MDTMTMTSNFNGNSTIKGIEDRFTAAVNVIRGLPKNGKYNLKKRNMIFFILREGIPVSFKQFMLNLT